ncbi:MAG: trimeric intracellular cation channel family protein [Peptococcaceae bacterium]|jgi:uncharacterized membrane protein YeiH|nr:trimeric intracellular cation channel family protein [Peptococcaceae bacterium]
MAWTDLLFFILQDIGTVAFALSGAMAAIQRELDVLGIVILGVITALGGGVVRDILLGITPPLMFENYHFLAVALVTSLLVYALESLSSKYLDKYRHSYLPLINLADAVGLGVFTVVGVNTAFLYGYGSNWFLVIFVGTTTGVTGGMLRDVLAGQVPMVLHKQIYVLASITGAIIYYLLYQTNLEATIALYTSVLTIILIRILAIYFKWNLPKVPRNR